MIYKIGTEDELYHYGVKGMKWGVRKEDRGSLRDERISRSANKVNARKREYEKVYGLNGKHDRLEQQHDNEVISINNKYGQRKNNLEKGSKNAKLSRTQKKAYEKEIQGAWDKYSSKAKQVDKDYKNYKKNNKVTLGDRYRAGLQSRNYKSFSKNNTLKMAWGREITNKKEFMKATPARIKSAKGIRGKGREIARTYLDMPVTVIGFTGTMDTTVRKRLKKGDLIF